MGLRLRQLAIALIGVVVAGVMVLLGIWQFDVYQAQGVAVAQRRAAEPPIALTAVAPAGTTGGEGLGRTVWMEGRFEPTLQLQVRTPGRTERRILTAFRQDDGSVVAVVRGVSTGDPAPPSGRQRLQGVFLPSEENTAVQASTDGELDAVVVPALAQAWPGPLVAGFVTLSPEDAAAQGLSPAPVSLPEARGRLRNGAYAMQWWIFAAFALVMAGRIIRDVERAALPEPSDEATEIVAGPPGEPT